MMASRLLCVCYGVVGFCRQAAGALHCCWAFEVAYSKSKMGQSNACLIVEAQRVSGFQGLGFRA